MGHSYEDSHRLATEQESSQRTFSRLTTYTH